MGFLGGLTRTFLEGSGERNAQLPLQWWVVAVKVKSSLARDPRMTGLPSTLRHLISASRRAFRPYPLREEASVILLILLSG